MESKFIEGTNEQYSIREDGVVLSNYRIRYSPSTNKYTKEIFIKPKIIIPDKFNQIKIKINNKKTGFSTRKLLLKYFNYNICSKCSNKYTRFQKQISAICKQCINTKKNATKRKWYSDNAEIVREKTYNWQKNINPEGWKKIKKKQLKKKLI